MHSSKVKIHIKFFLIDFLSLWGINLRPKIVKIKWIITCLSLISFSNWMLYLNLRHIKVKAWFCLESRWILFDFLYLFLLIVVDLWWNIKIKPCCRIKFTLRGLVLPSKRPKVIEINCLRNSIFYLRTLTKIIKVVKGRLFSHLLLRRRSRFDYRWGSRRGMLWHFKRWRHLAADLGYVNVTHLCSAILFNMAYVHLLPCVIFWSISISFKIVFRR